MNRLPLLLALLLTACASATPEPTRAEIIFITATPTLAVNGTPTEETLPFRDFSTATQTASPISPTATLPPATPTSVPSVQNTPLVLQPTQPGNPLARTTQPPQPTAPPTPTAIPPPAVSDTASAEQAVIDFTNAHRATNGLPPLARDEAIMTIARSRSADMVARGYFGHFDPVTGASLAKPQVLALGYGRAGENIYWSGKPLADFPAAAVNWFMSDPLHRNNLLNSGYTAIGVGIVWNGLGWTLTQDFGG